MPAGEDVREGCPAICLSSVPASRAAATAWAKAADEVFRLGLVRLGDLPGGGFYSYAWDVSADGTYIVGAGGTTTTIESFI
jgi:hypothetical protein